MDLVAPAVERAGRRDSRTGPRLAIASIVLSVVGVVLIPFLTFPLGSNDFTTFSLPAWRPTAFVGLSAMIFLAALALAILSRMIAGRGLYRARLWAILGTSVWLLLLGGAWFLNSFDGARLEPTSLYSQELVDSPSTLEHPLPFGTAVVLRMLGTRQPVMIVTADEPLIVTREAVAAGVPAPYDDYVAVPLTIEIADSAAAAQRVELPRRDWIKSIGAGGYWSHAEQRLLIPGYPLAELLDLTKPGVYHVYDIIDTSDYKSGEGAYRWSIVGSGSGGAYWR